MYNTGGDGGNGLSAGWNAVIGIAGFLASLCSIGTGIGACIGLIYKIRNFINRGACLDHRVAKHMVYL